MVRIFNTYGPRTHPNDGRVVSSFIVQALRNQDITIFGEGQQTRSFCYVDDLIRGLIAMMETGPEVIGPINLGNPTEFTIRELAELILELTGSRSKIVHRPLPQDDPQKRRPDISEAERVLALASHRLTERGADQDHSLFRAACRPRRSGSVPTSHDQRHAQDIRDDRS